MTDGYGGVVGAVPYALRRSDSWLFRSYALVGTLVVLFVGFVTVAGLAAFVADTAAVRGGTFTFSRSLFVLVGFLAAAPALAPILLVARRHRRGDRVDARYDTAMAASGYGFLLSLYLGLLGTVPPGNRTAVSGPLAPVVELFYAAPWYLALLVPAAGAAGVYLAHRRFRG